MRSESGFATKRSLGSSRSILLIGVFLLGTVPAKAQSPVSPAKKRSEILRELKRCRQPWNGDCHEEAVDDAAALYKKGDKALLPRLLDVAPNSDGALAEAIGEFLSELLCDHPITFLRALASRRRSEWKNLSFHAATADGSGMGCRNMDSLRRTLRAISRRRNDRLAVPAAICLLNVNKYNPR